MPSYKFVSYIAYILYFVLLKAAVSALTFSV